MYLNLIKHFLDKKATYLPLGISVEEGCEIVGVKATSEMLTLVALQKVDDGLDAAEAQEFLRLERGEVYQTNRTTNRDFMKRHSEMDRQNSLHHIRKVIINDYAFDVSGHESRRITTTELESVLELYEFMRSGWSGETFKHDQMDGLFIHHMTLRCDSNKDLKILKTLSGKPNLHIRFERHTFAIQYHVELPITLNIGSDYPERIWFESKKAYEKQWAQIHRVYLMDVYETLEKNLNDAKASMLTPQQKSQMKFETEKAFEKLCPRGMLLPVIEYECEEDISLQFYHVDYLEASPGSGGSAVGFISRPDQETGKWSYRLKMCVVQHAVPVDTKTIDVELFSFSRMIK